MNQQQAIEILEQTAIELAEIHRAKEFASWRQVKLSTVDHALRATEPFRRFADAWLFTGDGGGRVTSGVIGAWVIGRLVAGLSPAEILVEAAAQADNNHATYVEVSPVCGIAVVSELTFAPGIKLLPGRGSIGSGYWPPVQVTSNFARRYPADAALLCIDYSVSPAFELRSGIDVAAIGPSLTEPPAAQREALRRQVRSALLLSVDGAVELPEHTNTADDSQLFVTDGGSYGNWMASYPPVSVPIDPETATVRYAALSDFPEPARDSLERAIDRLGRSRLAINPADRALDLGIAAEIALSHEADGSNSEITFKIGTRAAWLLRDTPAGRREAFDQVKLLYAARSQAAHLGILSARSKVDLDASDALVAEALTAILSHGAFPNWAELTMGT